ncbi:threonine--tRNA ligase [Halobacteriovorax marinus]|uniref:Threonine--tRNA ligase n=1 Tax=Halobacteriovorax marinus TaxID=97084 RepID=A0A1Y5FB42_9BACT|nr:threonine--tRNA ligase [Halobacteriovorax marinus]
METNDNLYKIRHSLAHILAQAVLEVRPGSKLGFGPPIENGFYYDFILTEPLHEDDFKDIEKRMKAIIKNKQVFEKEDLKFDDAMARLEAMGEPYKQEYAKELFEKHNLEYLTFFKNGSFVDMCEGPHVENTKKIHPGCFKLKSVAGAYWRGSSDNQMMTRIYAWAFETKEELKEHVAAYQEALKRDHKKLGKDLDLFHIDDEIGKGLPLWLPNGTVIRDELEKFMRELEFKDRFQRITTPCLTKVQLYEKTGHLPYYAEGMFPFMEVKENEQDGHHTNYVLRPMNCPHHHKVFDSRKRSYRDLPIRFAEYGNVFRYESAGSLSGLLRVRGMCMNDAHIYCAEDQIEEEFLKVMKMHETVYHTLGLHNFWMRLSTWDPEDPKGKEKYVDDPAAWESTQDKVRAAMVKSGLPFNEVKGEAAFYGPKIDFQMKTVTGREETISTNQLDFAVPERLGLTYTDKDNEQKTPYCIHRAPAGTHERFVAFLIEHFAGAFPTWLAPVQVMILPVSENVLDYCNDLIEALRDSFVRVEIDTSNDSFNKKIRTNSKKRIPNMLIIGDKEAEEGTVTLKRYGIQEQDQFSKEEFITMLMDKIKNRTLES